MMPAAFYEKHEIIMILSNDGDLSATFGYRSCAFSEVRTQAFTRWPYASHPEL